MEPGCVRLRILKLIGGFIEVLLYGLQHDQGGDPFERLRGDKYVKWTCVIKSQIRGRVTPFFHSLEIDFTPTYQNTMVRS